MGNLNDHQRQFRPENGQDPIVSTYNREKYPIIERETNAFFFPWSMQRDVDAIDSMRFYTEVTAHTEQRGIEGIPASPKNMKNTRLR
ncbi:hypothetical protein [Thermohalobacter berrensis]|uniref:Uncharacterized protein n=1 Tax=Thermohalobacter berrensis TaxID=99594 RepID=A0A419SUY7_9FIRM|nr:hypothetical protein [Thermohalobacter berrensis]RKD29034.1 hypothetical protein BET03_06730 [Thermohalobacter berrensis]